MRDHPDTFDSLCTALAEILEWQTETVSPPFML